MQVDYGRDTSVLDSDHNIRHVRATDTDFSGPVQTDTDDTDDPDFDVYKNEFVFGVGVFTHGSHLEATELGKRARHHANTRVVCDYNGDYFIFLESTLRDVRKSNVDPPGEYTFLYDIVLPPTPSAADIESLLHQRRVGNRGVAFDDNPRWIMSIVNCDWETRNVTFNIQSFVGALTPPHTSLSKLCRRLRTFQPSLVASSTAKILQHMPSGHDNSLRGLGLPCDAREQAVKSLPGIVRPFEDGYENELERIAFQFGCSMHTHVELSKFNDWFETSVTIDELYRKARVQQRRDIALGCRLNMHFQPLQRDEFMSAIEETVADYNRVFDVTLDVAVVTNEVVAFMKIGGHGYPAGERVYETLDEEAYMSDPQRDATSYSPEEEDEELDIELSHARYGSFVDGAFASAAEVVLRTGTLLQEPSTERWRNDEVLKHEQCPWIMDWSNYDTFLQSSPVGLKMLVGDGDFPKHAAFIIHARQNKNPVTNKGSWTLCDLESECATSSSKLVQSTADALGFKLTSNIGLKLLIERRVCV